MINREDIEKQGINHTGFVPKFIKYYNIFEQNRNIKNLNNFVIASSVYFAHYWMLPELAKIAKAGVDFSLKSDDGSNFLMKYNKKYELGDNSHKSNEIRVNFLIDQGISLHAVNNNNENILFYCSSNNICYWIREGIDIYIKNHKGQTIWDVMPEYIHDDMKNARSVYEKSKICFDGNKVSVQKKIL